jgi:LysR family nitrogen assimilation transcriptional regulator
MDLRQLEYFVAVVEHGSISRAAVALNLAQPSVSRQIALLEEELGQRLLDRTGGGKPGRAADTGVPAPAAACTAFGGGGAEPVLA